jgi:hypothetical protein
MAFEHYCGGANSLRLNAFVRMCTHIGLVPHAISKAEVHARFRACLLTSSLNKAEGLAHTKTVLANMLGQGEAGVRGATEGLNYAGMLRCLRACAQVAYGSSASALGNASEPQGKVDVVHALMTNIWNPPPNSECEEEDGFPAVNFFAIATQKAAEVANTAASSSILGSTSSKEHRKNTGSKGLGHVPVLQPREVAEYLYKRVEAQVDASSDVCSVYLFFASPSHHKYKKKSLGAGRRE